MIRSFQYPITQSHKQCQTVIQFSITRRKGMQDFRRQILAYADPIYRPPPKPTEIPSG